MSLLGEIAKSVRPLNKSGNGWSSTTYNRPVKLGAKGDNERKKQLEIYGGVSTLFSIVSKISNSVGSVQWRLYRKREDGRRVMAPREIDRTEVARHPALQLLQKPNPFYTGSHFVESFSQHIELCGEATLVVSRAEGFTLPLGLWPVRPDRMEPVPDPETFLAGWIYKGPNGEQIPLEVDQVIHIKMPNPSDPYRGLGPVQALMQDLQATTHAARFNNVFFENDATPGGVIEVPESLSDSEFDRLQDTWRSTHQGVHNAHRVALLENGGKWANVQFTMRDMQFAELRHVSREIIREAYAMHGHMLGLTDDINRANAEAAEDVFARWLLVPRLDRIKDALNHQLLPMFGSSGEGVEFDFDDPSLEDSEANNAALLSKAQSAKLLIEAGGKFESVLEAVGLPEIEFDEEKRKQEQAAEKAKAEALQSGQKNSPGQIGSGSKEQDSGGVFRFGYGEGCVTQHNGFKTARPLARLKAGRSDWYRIENKAATGPVEVFIYDEIGYFGVTAADFARDFKQIQADEITLHLDTPGGDVFDAVNIYNAVADHPAHVTAVVDGLAASAGSFILQAGDKRVMNRYSTMMVHNGHSMVGGDAAAMRKQADLLDKITGTIAQVYTDKAGQSPDYWREVMSVETWYTAEEAMAAGLADEVIIATEKFARNDFDLSIFSYAGRDKAPAPVVEQPKPDEGIDWAALANAFGKAFA